jgi:hypothetical protein
MPKKKAAKKKPSARAQKPAKQIYQFKITLLGIKPRVWRRIQVTDGTLDDLHWHIQGAFGWNNSHLHDFDIGPDRYGIPSMLDMEEMPECKDSTKTRLSDILPSDGNQFAFKYTYDLGDNWEHEVLLEGVVTAPRKIKYPVCVEGERACPPEDCGGPGGYERLLEVLADPAHKGQAHYQDWVGYFDPEYFDAIDATAAMRELAE